MALITYIVNSIRFLKNVYMYIHLSLQMKMYFCHHVLPMTPFVCSVKKSWYSIWLKYRFSIWTSFIIILLYMNPSKIKWTLNTKYRQHALQIKSLFNSVWRGRGFNIVAKWFRMWCFRVCFYGVSAIIVVQISSNLINFCFFKKTHHFDHM